MESALLYGSKDISPLLRTIQVAIHETPPVSLIVWQDMLLPELRRGRIDIQEAYIANFWPMVSQEARRYARSGGDLDDLMGEGALALWEAVFGYGPRRHRTTFTAYVKNHIHQRIRRAYRREQGYHHGSKIVPLSDHQGGQVDDTMDATEWAIDLAQALSELPTRDREILQIRQLPASNHPDYETTRKRRQRARLRLREQLTERGGLPQ